MVEEIQENLPAEKIEKKKFGKLKPLLFLGVFLICGLIFLSSKIKISEQGDYFISKIPFIGQIAHLAKSSDRILKGEEEGKINILFLGMGGRGHEGGLLTDTIMLSTLDSKNKKVALLSIPRDLSIPLENSTEWTKINNINAFAEVKEKNSGGVAISQALADVLETPIDYYVRVDFEGFTKIIDRLGGLDIYVENTFDDYSYPITGREDNPDYYSRYEHLHFDVGWQKMNGETALKYARSRHGNNGEGSDFARAKRQQIILQAAKDKLLKTENLFNPVVLTGIISDLNEHVSTNLKIWEIIKLWSSFKNITKEDVISKVIDDGANGLLYATRNSIGSYILMPKNGDFSEIKYLLENIFAEPSVADKAIVLPEKVTVEIKNGTWINGLAQRVALDLEKSGFVTNNVGNASRQNFEKSVIYDLTFGEKIKSLAVLKEKTGALATFELPDWLKEEITADRVANPESKRPDFILVLGQDADKTNSGGENKE
ncbi:MAG: LCP family protein [Patescibacteria group bacterium]|jgi:LCP family protein required for cell wall assembly